MSPSRPYNGIKAKSATQTRMVCEALILKNAEIFRHERLPMIPLMGRITPMSAREAGGMCKF